MAARASWRFHGDATLHWDQAGRGACAGPRREERLSQSSISPVSDTRESSGRPCEATSAEVTIRCASRRFIKSLSNLHLNFRKSTYARRVRQPGEPVVQLYGKNRNNCILLSCSIVLRRAFRCGRAFTFVETKNVPETF